MKKLHKVSGWPQQDTAVGHYRIIQPLRFLKREGLVEESRTVPFTGDAQTQYYNWSDKTYMEICNGADAFMTTLLWKQEDILRCMNLRHHFGLKWIVDLDDNIWSSSKDNPATDHAETLMPNRELCLQLADGVTVSVPALKSLVERLNKNVFVNPNGLDFKEWNGLKQPNKRKIRIGWRGAYGHKEDLEMIKPVIENIKKNYPNVQFVTFGWKPEFSDEHHSYISFQKFPAKLASLGIDIAVVPLVDSAYNRCKSNLGWLEWSALSIPVCYSPTENQKNLPGLPSTTSYEWYENLSSLIDNSKYRRSVGEAQNKHAKNFYSAGDLVHPLATWISKLKRRTDIEPQ